MCNSSILMQPHNFSSDIHKNSFTAGNTALTPTTGSPAHKRAGLAIVQKGPHSLADRHARRFLVRVHQLRGDHLRVFGNHSYSLSLSRARASLHLFKTKNSLSDRAGSNRAANKEFVFGFLNNFFRNTLSNHWIYRPPSTCLSRSPTLPHTKLSLDY